MFYAALEQTFIFDVQQLFDSGLMMKVVLVPLSTLFLFSAEWEDMLGWGE